MDTKIETCPGCSTEPDKVVEIYQHSRETGTAHAVGYVCRCGARVVRGQLEGVCWR